MDVKIDTIAAQATPPGLGGVGIVRLSGPLVPAIVAKILDKDLMPRQACFCDFLSPDRSVIDKGVAIYFKAPNSFTGEDVLELHGHGGQVIMDVLLRRVLELGARLARPGEFTQRAFLNNKLDLVQAEAVADLINASTEASARSAMRSLQGEFSTKITTLVDELIRLRAHVEAYIDFAEEHSEEIGVGDGNVLSAINHILSQIELALAAGKRGAVLREGATVVIAGRPNAGKSSLFNCLTGQDSAIVTEIPGTTRDILRASIQIGGVLLHILDTAGVHDSPDLIEAEGIKKAKDEIVQAAFVLLVIDAATVADVDPQLLVQEFFQDAKPKKVALVYNKIDLIERDHGVISTDGLDCIYVAAKTQAGLDLLRQYLKEQAGGRESLESSINARARHLEALERARTNLRLARDSVANKELELMAEELRQAQLALEEMTGSVTADDILDKIFSEFCIGK